MCVPSTTLQQAWRWLVRVFGGLAGMGVSLELAGPCSAEGSQALRILAQRGRVSRILLLPFAQECALCPLPTARDCTRVGQRSSK